jgi:hypothetical protein
MQALSLLHSRFRRSKRDFDLDAASAMALLLESGVLDPESIPAI